MNNSYSFQDHLHNYATWTAARAVQRNFTNTKNIKIAIDKSKLKDFSELQNCNTPEDFENFHRECTKEITNIFIKQGIPQDKSTYGRAAKIIAIYLKTAIIIPSGGNGIISQLIHPPIDRVLSVNFSRKNNIKRLCEKGWTSLNEDDYWKLCERIKQEGFDLNWTLEKYWHPEQGYSSDNL